MTPEHPEPPPEDEHLPAPELRSPPEPPAAHSASAPADRPHLAIGAVVVYFEPNASGTESFRRAVAIGPEIIDPQTDDWWAPVVRPDSVIDLLPVTLIVTLLPGAQAGDSV